MHAIGALGVVCFVVASVVVGLRLLALARRTREAAEFAIGLNLVLAGGVGCVLLFVSARMADRLGSAAGWVAGTGLLCLDVGAVALWFFIWRVFRPDRFWAAVLFALALAAAAFAYLDEAWTTGFLNRRFEGIGFWSGFAARSLCFAWAAFESFRYHGLMRRRVRIGLAEPLLANRFLLWGSAAAAAFLIFVVVLANVLAGQAVGAAAGVFRDSLAFVVAGLGLVTALSLWLAFFPPPLYRRWFERDPLGSDAVRVEL